MSKRRILPRHTSRTPVHRRLLAAALTTALAATLLLAGVALSHAPARAATPTPTTQPTRSATATLHATPRPSPTPRATVRATVRATADATVRAAGSATPRASATPRRTPAATPRATPTPSAAADPLAPGLQAYKALGCGGCHTLAVAGGTGIFGPTHEHVAATALLRLADPEYAGSATDPEEYLREAIVTPGLYVPAAFRTIRYRMPDYSFATAEQVDALVALLLAQR